MVERVGWYIVMKYLINDREHPLYDAWLVFRTLAESGNDDVSDAMAAWELAHLGDIDAIEEINRWSDGIIELVPDESPTLSRVQMRRH